MTELFDEPIDKYDLPKHRVSSLYCLMVAAFGVASASIAEEAVDPSRNWSQVFLSETAPNREESETFCQNVAKHNGNPLAELIGRTFCGHEPKPPHFEVK